MLGAGLALVFATVTAAAQNEAADKAAFQKVCGACHSVTMVGDLKTESEWTETVDNMVATGAKGTGEQFAGIMRYLARNFTRVNMNTAAAAQIAPVLDVSDAVANAVVAYRARYGGFASLNDLKKVPGLDAARIEARKERIAFH